MSRTETRAETSPRDPAGAALHSPNRNGLTPITIGGRLQGRAGRPVLGRPLIQVAGVGLRRFWQARPQHWALLFCTTGREPELPNARRRQ